MFRRVSSVEVTDRVISAQNDAAPNHRPGGPPVGVAPTKERPIAHRFIGVARSEPGQLACRDSASVNTAIATFGRCNVSSCPLK